MPHDDRIAAWQRQWQGLGLANAYPSRQSQPDKPVIRCMSISY
jgi:hypothetical protein